ncbi:hypothetical protein DOTSEDRAFT_38355 [Dothistroma septosporum NZE10]|uniref:Uncharacterized protein n=1 Tax=Dothistroma septosporum (strain NZE10 / CBS 128990) TaxID=675120 RepID=M2YJJ8_DOTSN|nr:hypothetical protein DOTSEDRAFT_38355 [Dothistroma septosporum NZE10]
MSGARARGRPRVFACCGPEPRSAVRDATNEVLCPNTNKHNPQKYHKSCLRQNDGIDPDTQQWQCGICNADEKLRAEDALKQTAAKQRLAQVPTSKVEDKDDYPPFKRILLERTGAQEEMQGITRMISWHTAHFLRNVMDEGEKLDDWINGLRQVADDDIRWVRAAAAAATQPYDGSASGNPYWTAAKEGYSGLLERLWDDVRQHPSQTTILTDFDLFAVEGYEILAAMKWELLLAICGGSFTLRALFNEELGKALADNMLLSVKCPCIYMFEIIDSLGRPMTLQDLENFYDTADVYGKPDPNNPAHTTLAIGVDEADGKELTAPEKLMRGSTSIPGGTNERRFLENAHQRSTLRDLLNKLKPEIQRLRVVLRSHDRVPWVFREAGYTDDGPTRIIQQTTDTLANALMSLFDSIGAYLGGQYRIHGQVVYVCSRKTHASLGEMVMSLLGQTYDGTGKGFNNHAAGSQLKSLKNYDGQTFWDERTLALLQRSDFGSNMAAEDQRLQARLNRENSVALAERELKIEKIAALQLNQDLREQLSEELADLGL